MHLFFTKNGEILGWAWHLPALPSEAFYCVCGAASTGAKVEMIFDKKRFKLDLEKELPRFIPRKEEQEKLAGGMEEILQ